MTMKKGTFRNTKIGLRLIQALFAVVAIFGAIWQSTVFLRLTIQEFMMLYGAAGAVGCEVVIRLLEWKFPEKELEEDVQIDATEFEEEPEPKED